MKTKTVYSFGPDRVYVGPVELDESDLSPADEADVWLVPGNCLTTEPPPPVAGKRYFAAANGMWIAEDIPAPEPVLEPAAPQESDTPDKLIAAFKLHVPTLDERAAALRSEVQKHLDLTAIAYGFDDIRTAVTYADEPAVPRFQAQGRALRAWRSLVWDFCDSLQEKVESGERDEPTLEQLLQMMPVCDFLVCERASMPASGQGRARLLPEVASE